MVAISTIIRKEDAALSDERSELVVDPAYIGRELQRLTAGVPGLHDDMHVLTAIVQRLDNSPDRMLEELRARHMQQARFGGSDRLRRRQSTMLERAPGILAKLLQG